MHKQLNNNDVLDWISLSEAARRLTSTGDVVSQSSLSRYVAMHGEAIPNRVEGRARLIDFAVLVEHRRENVRVAARPTAPGQPARRFAGSKIDGSARKVQADAEMREMDLAVRRGQLTPIAEVEQAGREAIGLMRAATERAINDEAAALAVKFGWEQRLVRIALKQFSRIALTTFHDEILSRLGRLEADAAAERARELN